MTTPILIEETNLSIAWLKVLNYIIENPGKEICPLILSITGFHEDLEIKKELNSKLISSNLAPIQTVSETIFPQSLYQYCNEDRDALYNEYLNNIIRIKKIDPSNKNGTYFERLIAFDGKDRKINQLEIVISSLQQNSKNKRRSKLQASIFNPEKDHTNAMYQGFPCLQHVTFYKTKNNGLILNSFYAIQHLYRRAYGNWLGLINLGKFVAKESNLYFERFNCYVGVEQLDRLTKNDAQKVLDEFKKSLDI
ncbi:thymidylate synthase [Flagellimonas algicola]|uniref:Thymidylate synthase n=1 Tax=Flagellimonas algicola TaxID=2583815 RepID=A0ABY2WJU9_9FLAO|nr:thymidylate synthase [Allomuricauda algicola]TMU54817.1 thymidylate synthase [Allomuricauda algicola]